MMKSTVTYIGDMAFAFEEEKVLILFGTQAPAELRDISVIHEPVEVDRGALASASRLVVGQNEYEILSVGTEAMKNLAELGHLSIYFTDPPAEILPGSVYVKPFELPKVSIGTLIEIR
ncbi:PTS glucitol/sorbitol transporter subunit IIA [Alicyclobacillus cycloheptanicus]|jgi:PTS system glucitol/sorbitol-specific IIA component|uniref:PTS system glucitol/sorbitol-specific IIA component n=1 Tax=Alicyclobacillus cycloheptanicus TaxID=1457 RepID=A0ABT9XLL4_9BACL|nr:PTS glucitol/sorbitol transporter subunit IIA [Alicyclobacillus cycloheptanicus]MDQ0191198.1 PTS system glucitol/sorbitol-specific IIA component [Alicyclobacillus cycloheptanicus]WDM02112.1 PTS glucitol/sorbitol transporter subunit IIA [Alicyclobacillus cycloheptanicus]